MNNKTAHNKLKEINAMRNKIGVGGYRDSRKIRCGQHEKFNEAISEMRKVEDERKMQDE